MFVVMEEDDEGMGDDFLGGQLRSEAFDEDFLVLVMRKIAVNSDARINILFLGKDGFNREVLEVDRNGLRGRRFLAVLTGFTGCGALIFLITGVSGMIFSPLQIGMCERGGFLI